jgi:hypothetical protein
MNDSTGNESNTGASRTGPSREQILQTMGFARKAVRILSMVLLLLGVGIAGFGFKQLVESYESLRWPSVPGKIVASEVKGDAPSQKVPQAEISYMYRVNGREFRGSRVFFGRNSELGRPSAAATVRRYPPEAEVTVYYDPKDPSRSVLEPGLNRNAFLPAAVGLMLALFSQLGARRLDKLIDDFEQKVKTGELTGEPNGKAGGLLRPEEDRKAATPGGQKRAPADYRSSFTDLRPIEPSGSRIPGIIFFAALAAALFFLGSAFFR